MSQQSDSSRAPREFSDDELTMLGAYMPELRRSLGDQRILRSYLIIGFVAGLIAHVAGYLIRTSVTTEPWALLAELLYALGLALWTGIVVVLFVHYLPEGKRRQIERAIKEYEAARAKDQKPV